MRFSLQNINKVRQADILLDGLTVVAGANDSGKSTVGKLLFSTVKALGNVDAPSLREKDSLLEKYVGSLYKRMLSSTFPFRRTGKGSAFPSQIPDFIRALEEANRAGRLDDFLQPHIREIRQLEGATPRVRKLMLDDMENIRICLTHAGDRSAGMTTEIQYFIESEFMNKICSYHTEQSRVELQMDDSGKHCLSYILHDDRVKHVEVSDGEFLQDATYVESPLYLHFLDSLLYASAFREMDRRAASMRPMVPIHIKDLMEKVNSLRMLAVPGALADSVEVEPIIGGRFEYDGTSRRLLFARDGVSFFPINVASGIKSFGLVQMLLEIGAIDENRILIWDEPENHLHPEWQVEFANVLVELAKAGIPVLISTHSPYFIQGVRYFAARHQMEPFVNYYLAEGADGLSVFENVTDDLNRVFRKLAEPLNRIMNIGEAEPGGY